MRRTLLSLCVAALISCNQPASAQTFFSNRPAHLLDHVDAFSGAIQQVVPTFPARGVEIINALYKGVNPQDDGARRIAIVRVCEQMRFDLGALWSNKVRTGLDPKFFTSPDSIAWSAGDDQPVSVWDVQRSDGFILVHEGKAADHPNIPRDEADTVDCTATNHMGSSGPVDPPPVDPPPTEPPVDLGPVWAAIELLQSLVTQLAQRITALEARPVAVECRAAVFGIPVSCRLVTQ